MKKKFEIRVTFISGILNYLKPILSDFNKEVRSVYKKKKYDIHNIAGIGVAMMLSVLPYPNQFVRVICMVVGAWAAGFLNEGYQDMVKNAETDNRDIRMTGYGGVMALPIYYAMAYFMLSNWYMFGVGVGFLIMALLMNKKR